MTFSKWFSYTLLQRLCTTFSMILEHTSYSFFNKFNYFSEMLEPLKIYNPPMKNIVFLISQSALLLKHSLLFSKLIRQSHFCQFLSTFASLLDSILAPPDHFFDTHFRYLKKNVWVFFCTLLRRGHLRHISDKGGTGRSSGRPGRPQEAQRRLGGKSCQNHCVFQQISSRPPILSRRNESDPHKVL